MDALLTTATDQVYAEFVDAGIGRGAEIGRRLLDDPGRARLEAAEAVRRLWKAAMEPERPSMRQALRAAMLDRALQVNREGLRTVLPPPPGPRSRRPSDPHPAPPQSRPGGRLLPVPTPTSLPESAARLRDPAAELTRLRAPGGGNR